MTTAPNSRLTFRNFGGIYQLQIRDFADLAQIQALDPARWAATSAPVADLRCDADFLKFIDADRNGRVRVSDLLAARDWLFQHLSGRSHLHEKTESVLLADFDVSKPAGARLRQTAEHLLKKISAPTAAAISLAQIREFRSQYTQTLANGDGVVCPEVVSDPEVNQFMVDVMATVGSVPDLSGRAGVGQAQLDRFLERARAWRSWRDAPQSATGQAGAILPWGDETTAAAGLVEGLDGKMDQYFWQCDLLRQDPQAQVRLRWSEEELRGLKASEPRAIEQALAEAPLAPPQANGTLALDGEVNPFYRDRLARLKTVVLARVAGSEPRELSRAGWHQVREVFAAYFAWRARQPTEPFDKIPDDRMGKYLLGPLADRLRKLIAEDAAAASSIEQLASLERIVLYHRWLLELANNFVNFSAIYHPRLRALMEHGTIVMDGRRLEFSVIVRDRAEHKKVAAESLMFLVYAQVMDQDGVPLFEVATPVTTGDRGRLRVGKRGIFIGLDGRELDAVIVEMVENPISLMEAVKEPFRRAWGFVASKFHEFTVQYMSKAEKQALEASARSAAALAAPPAPDKPAAAGGGMSSILMGGGIALAAISSALAFVVSSLSQIDPLDVFYSIGLIVGIIAAISGFLGWLRLRRRDMAMLLEANGWALNVQMKLTGRLGRLFTRTPRIPKGSRIELVDLLAGFDEEEEELALARRKRIRVLMLIDVILLALGVLLYRLGTWDWRWIAGWLGW